MFHNRFLRLHVAIIITVLLLNGSVSAKVNSKQLSTKTLRSMARAYMAFGKYEKAHTLAGKAVQQAQAEGVERGELALCMIDMGTVCSYEGSLSRARNYLEKGVSLQQEALSKDHPYVAQTLRLLSDVYRQQGDLKESERVLSNAVRIMLDHCDVESKEMAPFILEAGNLKYEQGQLDIALDNYQKALDIYTQSYGSNHLMTANVLEKMARLYLVKNEPGQAGSFMQESLKIKNHIYGRYHPQLIDSWLEMARICRYQGQRERCEYYLAKSKEIASQSRNAITMARIYKEIEQIRTEGFVAAAVSTNTVR